MEVNLDHNEEWSGKGGVFWINDKDGDFLKILNETLLILFNKDIEMF